MLKRSLILSFIITVLGIVAVSCCKEEYVFNDFGVTLIHADITGVIPAVTMDTISQPFVYYVRANYDQLALAPLAVFAPDKLTALSCDEVYRNPFIESTQRVFFDKDIEVLGEYFAAGSNLLDLEDDFDFRDGNFSITSGRVTIRFTETFLAGVRIPNGPIVINFEGEQEDGTTQRVATSFVLNLP